MTEITTTETSPAATATEAAVTDIASQRAKRPSSRERARGASAAKQAAAGGPTPKTPPGGAAKAAAPKEVPAQGTANIGAEEPHTAKLRERFEALSATKQKAAIKLVRAKVGEGATRAGAWNAAMAEVAPLPVKPPAAPKAPKPEAKFKGATVKGYSLRWPHGGYDLLVADVKPADGGPAWIVRCNVHGTTKPVKAAKDGDALGTKAALPSWCAGCKADAAKA